MTKEDNGSRRGSASFALADCRGMWDAHGWTTGNKSWLAIVKAEQEVEMIDIKEFDTAGLETDNKGDGEESENDNQ